MAKGNGSNGNGSKPAKIAGQLPELVPQSHGGALLSGGVPGHKGGSGRPPNAFKDFLARLRADPDAHAALEAAATNAGSKNFKAAWDVVTDYDDDKPAKKVELVAPLTTSERLRRLQALLEK